MILKQMKKHYYSWRSRIMTKYVLIKETGDEDKILFKFGNVSKLEGTFDIVLLTFKELTVIAKR